MKIKSYLKDVDQLIAKVKAVSIKNKTKQAKFLQVGKAQPVPTSWRSWLNAAFFLHKKICLQWKQLWKVL